MPFLVLPTAPGRAEGPISWGQTRDPEEVGGDGMAQSRGSCTEPRGAVRCWEATAEIRGDPQWGLTPHRAAAEPVLTPGCPFTAPLWYPHLLLTPRPPSLFSRSPFTPSAPSAALRAHSPAPALLPRHPKHPPRPPGAPGHLPRGSPPRGGSLRGSLLPAPSRGCLGVGHRPAALPEPRPAPLPLSLGGGGNHSPYRSVAILAERKRAQGSLRAARGCSRPGPAPLGPGAVWGTHGVGLKEKVTSSAHQRGTGREIVLREQSLAGEKGRWRGFVQATRRIWALMCIWDPPCPESRGRGFAESRGCLQPGGWRGFETPCKNCRLRGPCNTQESCTRLG